MLARVLRPFVIGETYRALLYGVSGVALGSLAFAVLVAGWTATLVLAITPLVFPLLFGLRWAVGQLARVQATLANGLLGGSVSPPTRTTQGASFWSRALNVLRDTAFWKQQAHLLLTWPLALIPLVLVYWALLLLTLPVWSRWVESSDVIEFDVDSRAQAVAAAAVGLVLLTVAVHVLRAYAWLARWLASRLLAGVPHVPRPRRTRDQIRRLRFRAFTVATLASSGVVVTLIAIWYLTSGGYFWPIWPMLGLALAVGSFGWVIAVLENNDIPRIALGSKALAIQIGVSAILVGFLVAVWAITTGGYFWPAWPALGLAVAAGVHAAVVYGRRTHRIERLERSRAAAVDIQEADLRRIERDLHDGAQARLVSLGMSLGMAEEKLRKDPESALALLAEARSEAKEALEELRDLARGIHPPILTDRGLEAAIAALAARSPVPVTLTADVPTRPPSAVETAAYFVVAEALANAIKYSEATRIDIRLRGTNGLLVAEVIDDGRGGADPAGDGLTGLEQRVRALDGSLQVASPAGGPTTVRAELPCE
jgi:signal transduction histidine kinase